jgi:hypothetical protein
MKFYKPSAHAKRLIKEAMATCTNSKQLDKRIAEIKRQDAQQMFFNPVNNKRKLVFVE